MLSYDKCVLLKDHNAVTSMRLEPAAPRSLVKHSTTVLPNDNENASLDWLIIISAYSVCIGACALIRPYMV